ncbi:hypothetical protein Nepgr_011109 [Nepenthes gracilis]|uniref:RING-type domain-containing protein n=1 Tax=Nepenthes gracilis TaxID=150966 RepID=A0AAD3XLN2_NEPGR|nr:hypothetical protein Nepgr_011109 [Nepenthes gracilis]
MAVQAQYPSNAFLLDRNGQEGKNVLGIDYSLQTPPVPSAAGGLTDQPHMLFNVNGVVANNPRKRGREVTTAAATATATARTTTTAMATAAANMNPFNFNLSLQNHPRPQLMELAQHQNHHRPNVVSTGLKLSFGDQQQQQHHNVHPQSSVLLTLISKDSANQIKQQSEELNQFLQAQGEQLRRTLAEKRRRHYRALLGAAEEMVAQRLMEKEAEMEKAARRNAELEARAAQLSAEAQVWQAKARAQEAQAASLQAQLQQAIMTGGGGVCSQLQQPDWDGAPVLGSAAYGGVLGQAEDAESAYIDPERVGSPTEGPSCKACRMRAASVVVLPCRHLCVCAECDALVRVCPLCLSLRNGGVEVYLT